MASINDWAARLRWWCDCGNLGYNQSNRYDLRVGGEVDCSSLVILTLQECGFDTGSASYTGDMSDELRKHGWQRLNFNANILQVGDIVLNEAHHVVVVTEGSGSSCKVSYASIDENGRISGGEGGDQTDRETLTRGFYTPSYGWDCILRYCGADSNSNAPSGDTGGAGGSSFPLPSGHWYGTPKSDDRNHSGFYWDSDRPGIRQLQGVLGVSVDGMYGNNTEGAARTYQSNNGLAVDGEVGINTWTKMFG